MPVEKARNVMSFISDRMIKRAFVLQIVLRSGRPVETDLLSKPKCYDEGD